MTPLDVLPGLAGIARAMADAVAVTDLHRRIVVWNSAAVRLYGIPTDDALSRPIDELYDSTIVGKGTSSAGVRAIAMATGSWRGRVADRPRVGRLAGQELVIETVLSRVDSPDGRPVGIISVKRDVTPGVRLERELATIISLSTTSGEHRDRQGVAKRALQVLVETTGASLVGIVVPGADGRVAALATYGANPTLMDAITGLPWSESPAVKAASSVGRIVKGSVSLLPVAPATRRALLDGQVRTLAFVGLHQDDQMIGLLVLAWDRDDPVIPSDAVLLLAATHIARGLENARLVEEIVRRAESERALVKRLRTLDELTRVGGHVATVHELAERSARLINASLSAAGTAYGLIAEDGEGYDVAYLAEIRPEIAEWLTTSRPGARSAFRRWRSGEGAFLERFEPGNMSAETLDLARQAGLTAYAAIPIRVDDALVGGIVAYFDRPAADLDIDRSALDHIATTASISLANFRLRERLLASEERYRSIFAASPDAILVVTQDGQILDANDAATRLFRADVAWLVGRRAADLTAVDLSAVRPSTDALALGESLRLRPTAVRRDGETFPSEVEVAAVDLDGGRRYLVRVRDLTDQERLQAELVQAQKMEATGQLVSGVAHELNNPLAAIILSSELIRRDAALPEDLRHNADLLVEEATRTKRIVQNLLDFARQRPPERYPTSIRALIESVLTLQSYSLGRDGILVETEIGDDLPLVELDRGQLQQVLVNLTHNAIYAIREGSGSRIHITAATEGPADAPRVRVTVMDDGTGVPPEVVEHLFEAFFTTKPAADGTGLGLPVSYGIVKSHGGELRYAPSALGRGAAFTFDLPVHAIANAGGSTPSEPEAKATAPLEGPKTTRDADAGIEADQDRRAVLVLDDEPSIRVFLAKALKALGYDPVVAEDGPAAIALADGGPYHAILCDHQMPDMSGIEVYEALVAMEPSLAGRFVMMSGDVLNAALDAFASSHDVLVMAKPFDLETLGRTLREVGAGQPRG
ncbi:MAG: PAS domain S-box protein [Chloroflexota bacterium]